MRAALALVALAAFAPAAHADENVVHANYGVFRVPPGGGTNFVVVECDAGAVPASAGEVPVATSIGCSVDGIEMRGVAPGPQAATAAVAVVASTFEVCSWAEATFYNVTTHAFSTAVSPPYCVDVEW